MNPISERKEEGTTSSPGELRKEEAYERERKSLTRECQEVVGTEGKRSYPGSTGATKHHQITEEKHYHVSVLS